MYALTYTCSTAALVENVLGSGQASVVRAATKIRLLFGK